MVGTSGKNLPECSFLLQLISILVFTPSESISSIYSKDYGMSTNLEWSSHLRGTQWREPFEEYPWNHFWILKFFHLPSLIWCFCPLWYTILQGSKLRHVSFITRFLDYKELSILSPQDHFLMLKCFPWFQHHQEEVIETKNCSWNTNVLFRSLSYYTISINIVKLWSSVFPPIVA